MFEEPQTSFTPTGSLMDFVLQPWQLYLVILAGWIHRQQQEVIDYLHTENQVLKQKIGKKRILLNDDQRRRLAVKGRVLGRKRLEDIGTLFTPDTILRWHRLLVAKKWDYSERRKSVGRPRIRQVIVDLILRFAKQNPSWGYDRMIFFGGNSLRRAVFSFLSHYHGERNHQGLGKEIIAPGDEVGAIAGKIECRERFGGILKYYYRKVA